MTGKAVNGKAKAVIAALAKYWSIPKSYLRIKQGLASRDKMILIYQP
jgi:uncharacterized protein YggU (UPF0235/DUF167 family)